MPGRLMAAVEENLGDLYDPEAGRMAIAFTVALEALVAERNAQLDAIVARLDARMDDIDKRLLWLEGLAESADGIVAAAISDVGGLVAAIRQELAQFR